MGHFDKTHQSPIDDLASKVTEQVSKGQLDSAYAMFKKELHEEFSTMPLDEKKEAWSAISKKLEDNGTLPKLAGAWLADITSELPKNGPAISRGTLDSIAKNALDPFYSGLAGAMEKQFDVASRLQKDDGVIDSNEVAAFKARQTQPTQEKFVNETVNLAEKISATSPQNAYKFLSQQVFDRTKRETPEEEAATWKAIDEKLAAIGLVPKLSMGFLQEVYGDKPVTLKQVSDIQRGTPNPLTKELTGYVVEQFPKIGTVDYHLDEISVAERNLYIKKLSDKH